MVLENIIRLVDGVPVKVHLADHNIEKRTITEPVTGNPAIRNVLVFEVDRFNDREVSARLSTMADGLAEKFTPYLPDKSYRNYNWIIIQSGEGFRRRWEVKRLLP